MGLPLFLAVTKIICLICFNTSYKNEHPIMKTIQTYNDGIMESLGTNSIVDIFPKLKVRMRTGPTFRSR